MRVIYKEKTISLPDFIIPGAACSGVTDVYNHLRTHPEIFIPDEKEPMFFCRWGLGPTKDWVAGKETEDWTVHTLDAYSRLFSRLDPWKILGETSVWYLYDYKTAIKNIKKLYGNHFNGLKIIIMLRNPVERAFAQYQMKHGRGREHLSFSQAIKQASIDSRREKNYSYSYDYLGFGMYSSQIKAWINEFPDTKVLLYEDFIKNRQEVLNDIYSFLGVSSDNRTIKDTGLHRPGMIKHKTLSRLVALIMKENFFKKTFKKMLPQRTRRLFKHHILKYFTEYKTIPLNEKRILKEYYSKDICLLEKIINRNLSFWE